MRRAFPLRVLWILATLLAGGCAPADPASAMLAEYEQRVARALGADLRERPLPELSPWPRARARSLHVPPQRTGLGGFLSLHRCNLGELIGERSSQLGRVMEAPERLNYEHRFLLLAEQCLQQLAGDPERAALREQLADIVAEKRRHLPAWAWNATLGGDALAAAHSLDAVALAPAEVQEAGRAEIAALYLLAARLPQLGNPGLEPAAWHAPFETLAQSSMPGRLRRSAQALTHHLDGVAALLESREAQRPLCPQGTATGDADILWNIFRGYHAQEVQPYLVAVDRTLQQWWAALQALRVAQRVAPPAGFELVASARAGGLWPELDRARERHVAAWRVVLSNCGLLPGGE